MIIKGIEKREVEIEVSKHSLANLLINQALELLHKKGLDDAGLDWYTDTTGGIFIGGRDWHLAQNIHVAALVNAANVIRYGHIANINGLEASLYDDQGKIEMIWEDISEKGQSKELHVIEQLVYNNVIVAQIWKHNENKFSMTIYKDQELDGHEHIGNYDDLKNIAKSIFYI